MHLEAPARQISDLKSALASDRKRLRRYGARSWSLVGRRRGPRVQRGQRLCRISSPATQIGSLLDLYQCRHTAQADGPRCRKPNCIRRHAIHL